VHSNEEVEMAVREWLQMQGADFNGNEIFELALRWDKCVAVLKNNDRSVQQMSYTWCYNDL
jgi:hypothetical protein